MKFKEYLQSKAITFCFLALGALVFFSLSALCGLQLLIVALFAVFYFLIVMGWIVTSFFIERAKVIQLEKLIKELPEKYLLAEVLPVSSNYVEKRYFKVIKEVSRSALNVAECATQEKKEYCEYVESWIHEIKTPLTACSLILASGGDVQNLKTELKRADNLTENILYYARIGTAEKDTKISSFSASEIIDQAIKSQMELLIASKISVQTEGDFKAYSDPKSVHFILKQLLINCAKYCSGCMVLIKAQDNKITVQDNGIGIPSYELSRVTDRGFTGLNGRKFGSSTGMGLYIVRQLCNRLEIDLQIESKQSEYTLITLLFTNLTKM